MMKHLLNSFFVFVLLLATIDAYGQSYQALLNEAWKSSFGSPNHFDWASSTLDSEGNYLTISHSIDSTGRAKLLLIKQTAAGAILWEKNYTLSNHSDNYGIDLVTGQSDEVFVIGCTKNNAQPASNFDFLILKYDTYGNLLWVNSINGTGNGNDIPVGITLSSSNTLFVTGLSTGTTSSFDYLTACLSSQNGAIIWQQRYDYNELSDIPTNLVLDASQNVIVTGGSGASLANWEMATLKYSPNTGTLLSENRLSNTGIGISLPSSLQLTVSGDILLTGILTSSTSDFDICTAKINSSGFTTSWVKTFGVIGAKDSSVVAQIDLYGDVVVCGWSENADGGRSILLLKYDAQGTLKWQKTRKTWPEKQKITPRQLLLDAQGDILIVSNLSNDGKDATLFSGFDKDGNLQWERKRELASNSGETVVDMQQYGLHQFWLTAITGNLGNKEASTFKFERYNRDVTPVVNGQGLPTHTSNELIVRFNPEIVNTSFVNNLALEFGKISDVVQNSSAITAIDSTITAGGTFSDWDVLKIYKTRTTADSLMTTFDGRVLQLPSYWASFVLKVPRTYGLTLEQLADLLNDSPELDCFVVFAELNHIGTLDNQCDPNDPLYLQQASLHPTAQFQDGHINCEEAWCETSGSNAVKMAIFDTGIRWSHEDFGDGTFSGSIVEDGKDFFGNIDVNAEPVHTTNAHGTNVTGIVGAIRNNAIGVAGISGGENGSGGTRFLNIKAFGDNGIFFGDIVCAAYDAFINDEFTADIINISASYPAGDGGDTDPVFTQQEIREKLRLLSQKGIVHIGSAGNAQSGQPNYPAAAQDEWMINVSGSNQLGQVQGTNYGPTVDLIAPSADVLVFTTDNASDQAYSDFNGTSSAAPHVAGVAALLLAYDNGASNFTPDDIENILQASATDVTQDPATVGPDDYSGWGLLNASAAINLIKKPNCGVYHFGTDISDCTKTVEQIAEDLPIFLRETFTNAAGIKFAAGNYLADVYKITATCSHILPSPFTITRSWERHSTSSAFGLYEYEPNFYQMDALVPVEHVELQPTVTNNQATIVGYAYYLKNNPCTVEGWLPVPPQDAQLTYSVLGCMTTAVNEIEKPDLLQVFPNPATDLLSIRLKSSTYSDKLLSIYSAAGMLVSEQVLNSGMETFQMDIAKLPQGVYWLRCQTEKGEQIVKFIKI
ncbi:MAG TPA: hypothetical protein DCF33_02530 [Saprospirales bacterium]|nr:hypothetical protein [Saprospirales bacterium]